MKILELIATILYGSLWFCTVTYTQELSRVVADRATRVNIVRKSKESKVLVNNAVKHFLNSATDKALEDFIYTPTWRKGELFVFVFTQAGICLAHGDDSELIWKDISSIKGIGGSPLIKDMLMRGPKGGRISYLWDNGFKASYVKVVVKNGVKYVIGSGFYPENDEYTTQQMVKTAVAYFYQNGKDATFALINNQTGPFVRGDIYSFVYDFKGVCVAHGNNAALPGQNLIDLVDSRGKPLVKALINLARRGKGRGWVDYYWSNEFKRSYLERVVDPKTKKPYLISAGYYPNVDLRVVRSFVDRAIRHLKSVGAKEAFSDFSNQAGDYIKGGLTIFVYDFNGKCLADGDNQAFVGQNLMRHTDQEGRYNVKQIIMQARKLGKALISYTSKNAYTVAYVERIDVPDGKFVIGCDYYPAFKAQSTQSLVDHAVDYLGDNKVTKENAFRTFSTRGGDFYRGDLTLFVYDTKGTRLINGAQTAQIWRNFLKTPDETGKSVVGDLIATAMQGGGWLEYVTRNARRRSYVRAVSKLKGNGQAEHFIIGSGYFL
jgi:cytochrome c